MNGSLISMEFVICNTCLIISCQNGCCDKKINKTLTHSFDYPDPNLHQYSGKWCCLYLQYFTLSIYNYVNGQSFSDRKTNVPERSMNRSIYGM